MDKATPASFKELKLVMRFVAANNDYGLKVEPTKSDPDMFNWNMFVYTDSNMLPTSTAVEILRLIIVAPSSSSCTYSSRTTRKSLTKPLL
jgi:hypothetical protein